ncbi:MAG: hypothetical protein KDB79_03130 [Acidobacteria bacterium]|nr:hypothetical protein [Acidobacteriota bacterium]
MQETQNYQNHTRWLAPFHFFLSPLLLVSLIYFTVRLVQEPTWDHGMFVLLLIGIITIAFLARTQALTVQNRVIRLEERLRYKDVLSADLAERALKLKIGQMIGLRFASDEELPDLVERTLNGEFENTKDIKMAVKNWRGDHLRA